MFQTTNQHGNKPWRIIGWRSFLHAFTFSRQFGPFGTSRHQRGTEVHCMVHVPTMRSWVLHDQKTQLWRPKLCVIWSSFSKSKLCGNSIFWNISSSDLTTQLWEKPYRNSLAEIPGTECVFTSQHVPKTRCSKPMFLNMLFPPPLNIAEWHKSMNILNFRKDVGKQQQFAIKNDPKQ